MIRRLVLLLVLASCLLGVVSACGPDGPSRTVIVIFIDTLRADHLGCYGYDRPTSPHLDALAAAGVVFENTISQASWTLPSFMAVFTSQYQAAGKDSMNVRVLPESIPVMTEYFQEQGWATGGFVDAPFIGSKYKFDRGFDFFNEDIRAGTKAHMTKALEWLRKRRGRDRFVFLHTFDVHGPYTSPSPWDTLFVTPQDLVEPEAGQGVPVHAKGHVFGHIPKYQYLEGHRNPGYYVARYDGCVRWVDTVLGEFFDELKKDGLYDDALIVVSSDHGESLGEHHLYFDHGMVTDPVLRVPLIVKLPGNRHAGQRHSGQVQLIDVMPTLMEYAGMEATYPLAGSSLLPLMAGEIETTAVDAYSYEGMMDQWSVRSADLKYVRKIPGSRRVQAWQTCPDSDPQDRRAVVEQLFDLKADPGELVDLATEFPELLRERAALVDSWNEIEAARKSLIHDAGSVELDEKTKQQLRSLGYLGG